LLRAPLGQLSGDGQLRELFAERRDRKGPDAELWYLPAPLAQDLALGDGGQELVVAADPAVITWLQLRFGGSVASASLSPALLWAQAGALPPPAAPAALGHIPT
jgi:hypothetical protein